VARVTTVGMAELLSQLRDWRADGESDKSVARQILPPPSAPRRSGDLSCQEHMNNDDTNQSSPAPEQPSTDDQKSQIKEAKAKLKVAKAAVKTAKKEAGKAKKELKGLKKEQKKAATKAKSAKK
jgi:hypothetical protein